MERGNDMPAYASTTRCTESEDCSLPRSPAWISEELVMKTLSVWQPFYSHPLTEDDARQIIMSVGRLIDVVRDSGGNHLSENA